MSENNRDKIFEDIMSHRTIEIVPDEEIRENERRLFSSRHTIHILPGTLFSYELPYKEPDDVNFLVINGRILTVQDVAGMIDWGISAGMKEFANFLCSVRSNVRNELLEIYANRLKLLEE